MTITTTYFRDNLAEVINTVASGKQIVLAFGKGKKAKQILLSPTKEDTARESSMIKFVDSEFFQNHKTNKNFKDAQNLKELMTKYYTRDK